MLEVEKILKLSKNRTTIHQAQKLSKSSYWKVWNKKGAYLWANFKGKSIQSYQPYIELSDPIKFKCNCSSRQNPCKHGLALLLLYQDQHEDFKTVDSFPKGLVDWIKAKKDVGTPVDENYLAEKAAKASQAKSANRQKRIDQMIAGSFHIQEWLLDVMKRGLAQLEGQPEEFWSSIVARAVDHKLGGLTFYINELYYLVHENDQWANLLPLKLAWLNQVLYGFQNFESWKPEWQMELLRIGGVTTKSEELENLPGVEDDWAILHLEITEADNGGYFRKCWLIGKKTNRLGYLMEFNFREPKFSSLPKVGRWFNGEIVFYPGPTPLRMRIRKIGNPLLNIKSLPGLDNFKSLNVFYQQNLKNNPWLLELPVIVHDVIPQYKDKAFLLDKNGKRIDLDEVEENWWKVMAVSAGTPIAIFAIWNGYQMKLKGVSKQERYYTL